MSDKPNIFSHCKAGCLWETVHKDDFLKSASIVEIGADDSGIVTLDATQPQTYRIVSERDPLGASAYVATVMLWADDDNLLGATGASIPIKEFDEYRNYFEIEVLSFSSTATEMTFVYEVNGNRYIETVTGGTAIDGTTARLAVTGATAVYLYNRYATVKAEDGEDGTITNLVQTTGDSETEAMSQKATTDAINTAVATAITTALNTEV